MFLHDFSGLDIGARGGAGHGGDMSAAPKRAKPSRPKVGPKRDANPTPAPIGAPTPAPAPQTPAKAAASTSLARSATQAAPSTEVATVPSPRAKPPAPRPASPPRSIAGGRSFRALAWATVVYLAIAFLFAGFEGVANHGASIFIAAGAAIAGLAVVAQLRFNGAIALVMAASFSAQIVWAAAADTLPFGEYGVLWAEAKRFSETLDLDALSRASSPGAVAVWGLAMAVIGDDVVALRVLAAGLWTTQTWLVWRIAASIPEVRRQAIGAAALFGLAPAMLAFGGVVGTEAIFGVFALSALYVLLTQRRRGLRRSAALGGGLAGLAYLVSPTGLAHFGAVAAVLSIGASARRAALRDAGS